MEKFNPAPSCSDIDEYGSLRAEQALELILNRLAPVRGAEWVPLHAAAGRVLADDILSGANVPAHTNSAVDGYALRSSDLSCAESGLEFKVIDTALAGQPARSTLKPLTAIRIMTGAMIPEGADTVLMQEHAEITPDSIRIHSKYKAGENIRAAGEDLRIGEVVLRTGRLCGPADVGLLASLGFGEARVRRRVRVGVLSTGSEIKGIGTRLDAGNVFDSNRYTLNSALQQFSLDVSDYGIVPDDKDLLENVMATAQNENDLVISTGGVSVGEADHTRTILQNRGEILFSKVAIKPGRPLTFASAGSKSFFGLPGNPVAVMVTYYQFVWPALRKLMGITAPDRLLTIQARALDRIRKKPGRTEYQRGILERTETGQWTVRVTGRQGSGILRSMSLANAFIVLPHDAGTIETGDEVAVQPFEAFR
ncbi:MAG: molybdopterin molybdotransferase MoeA [Methylococcaceae bacterium]|nr:molybdopterin molybdotransferase MoeA [Methylococcaceae bacterium]MCI0732519.1 molybdopterin molybdotransferase MoeA [Methylococcaceae bacterium]